MSDQSMSGLEQKAEDIRSQVVDTAESLREKMTGGHLVDDLMSSETVSAATGALSSLGRQIRSNPVPFALIGVGLAQRSVRAIADTVSDQDPLLLAALGLAFGTALGAMLPGTRLEDETFDEVGKVLRQAGEAQLEAGLEKVKEVAGSAVEAAEQKAEESGLLPTGDGPTVAERVSEVANTAVEAARNTLRGRGSEPS